VHKHSAILHITAQNYNNNKPEDRFLVSLELHYLELDLFGTSGFGFVDIDIVHYTLCSIPIRLLPVPTPQLNILALRTENRLAIQLIL
jgi:hypothetical protein